MLGINQVFCFFVNYIDNAEVTKYLMFADDIKVHFHVSYPCDHHSIDDIASCCKKNDMELNVDK